METALKNARLVPLGLDEGGARNVQCCQSSDGFLCGPQLRKALLCEECSAGGRPLERRPLMPMASVRCSWAVCKAEVGVVR